MTAQLRGETAEPPPSRKSITPRVGAKAAHGAKQTKPVPLCYDYEAAISQPDISKTFDFRRNFEGASIVSTLPTEKKTLTLRGRGTVLKKSLQTRSQAVSNLKSKAQAKQRLRAAKNEKIKDSPVVSVEQSENCSHVSGDEAEEDQKNSQNKTVTNENSPELVKDIVNISNEDAGAGLPRTVRSNNVTHGTVLETGKTSNVFFNTLILPFEIENRNSKIARANTTIVPITYHEPAPHPVRKSTLRSKSKNSIGLKRPHTTRSKTIQLERRKSAIRCRDERVLNHKSALLIDKESNIAQVNDEASEVKISEKSDNYEFTSTAESPNPSSGTLLKDLKRLDYECELSTDHTHETSSPIEQSWSESRHSPEIKNSMKNWSKSLKHRKYIQITSEESDFSDYSNKRIKVRKKNICNIRSTLTPMPPTASATKSTRPVNSPAKIRSRRRGNFSFFNALFDIVFWPFLFLRADR